MTNLSDKLTSMLPERRKLDPDYEGSYWQECCGYNQAIKDMAEKFKKVEWDEEKIFKILLKKKYPEGLPLLPNIMGGGTLKDCYPNIYKQAKALTQADLIKES